MSYRLLIAVLFNGAVAFALTPEQLKLLRDPAGWEYRTITDANNGFETQATCFTDKYTGQCRGNLLLREDGTFTQTVSGSGRSMHRGGRYDLQGDHITFWDEHNTRDGPYGLSLNRDTKTLRMESTQAGVAIRVELVLATEFRKHQR